MLTPVNRQSVATLTPNEWLKKLLQTIHRTKRSDGQAHPDRPKIRVSSVVSRVSFVYEKMRNAVDYREEYLLQKDAINRILRRQVLIESSIKNYQPKDISRHLLTELIRGGYLPNNQLPAILIDEVAVIIDKYLTIKNLAASAPDQKIKKSINQCQLGELKKELSERSQLVDWLLAVCASEIETNLDQNAVLNQATYNLYQYLSTYIKIDNHPELLSDLPVQIYLAVNRSFAKLDNEMLAFVLFKYYVANWTKLDQQQWPVVAGQIKELKQLIDRQLNHPLAQPLEKIVHRYAVCTSIMVELLNDDPVESYISFRTDPEAFPRLVKKTCEKKYAQAKKTLWQAAFRSIIYIFLTKSVLVVALEIPANHIFGATVPPGVLLINVLFPAALLFLSVLLTRLPDKNNTNQIIAIINELSFEENKRTEPIVLSLSQHKRGLLIKFFNFLHGLTFVIAFGAIIWLLIKIQFTWVSILIFLFFLVFVSFFIIRIKRTTNELNIIDSKEGFWRTIFDVFTLPIISVGKYLSEKFSKMNFFVFFLDFIIETPFKFFIDVTEDWTNYVKERKSQIN